MAKRLSNRQRIERMAEEASIEAEDKETKAVVRKTSRSRKAAPKQVRMKIVWKVLDENSREIASFPYPEEAKAQARAAELSEKTGKTHMVDRARVPMADDE
jgi:HJR/Mrr/RecB family endonuclease